MAMVFEGELALVPEAGPLLFRNLSWPEPAAVPEPSVAPAPAMLPEWIEAAREEGRQQTAAHLQQELERRVEAERAGVVEALDNFLEQKRRYFAGLEKEVVRLALAIAERVLHRETAMDPTLLAGAARVALDQVDGESGALLMVSPAEAAQWRSAVTSLGATVELREEPTLEQGRCLLQTQTGSFEVGMRAQLCEIERGFFELMGRTPAVAL